MKPSQLLRERGWCQGQSEDGQGRRCILGSIGLMHVGYARFCAVTDSLHAHLNVGDIAAWNDTPGRTVDEVIAALEAIGE